MAGRPIAGSAAPGITVDNAAIDSTGDLVIGGTVTGDALGTASIVDVAADANVRHLESGGDTVTGSVDGRQDHWEDILQPRLPGGWTSRDTVMGSTSFAEAGTTIADVAWTQHPVRCPKTGVWPPPGDNPEPTRIIVNGR